MNLDEAWAYYKGIKRMAEGKILHRNRGSPNLLALAGTKGLAICRPQDLCPVEHGFNSKYVSNYGKKAGLANMASTICKASFQSLFDLIPVENAESQDSSQHRQEPWLDPRLSVTREA